MLHDTTTDIQYCDDSGHDELRMIGSDDQFRVDRYNAPNRIIIHSCFKSRWASFDSSVDMPCSILDAHMETNDIMNG